jgi:hypothetical protein
MKRAMKWTPFRIATGLVGMQFTNPRGKDRSSQLGKEAFAGRQPLEGISSLLHEARYDFGYKLRTLDTGNDLISTSRSNNQTCVAVSARRVSATNYLMAWKRRLRYESMNTD